MRNAFVALAMVGLLLSGQHLQAQTAPTAVVADSPADTKFPPTLAGITVPSHGVDMDAILYLAEGAGPHGTVLLLHGLPGYESNGPTSCSIHSAGGAGMCCSFIIVAIRARPGTFTHQVRSKTPAEVVRFLVRDPANAEKYCRIRNDW